MKKSTKILLAAGLALVLAAGALLAVLVVRHEKAQSARFAELSAEIFRLQEENRRLAETAGGEETARVLRDLQARITRLEAAEAYGQSDYGYLAVGNSITLHPVNEVWWQAAGMAASAKEKDFVHRVADALSESKGTVGLQAVYFHDWETGAPDRASALKQLDPYLDPRIRLITLQLGENVTDKTTLAADFETLIGYLREKAPEARILVIDNFFPDAEITEIKKTAAENTGADFVSLAALQGDASLRAGPGAVVYDEEGNPHTIEHPDVAEHPGDEGMRRIAEAVLEALADE